MKDWTKTLISPDCSIQELIQVIDAGALKIALVVDEEHRLLGTVTDGDVRRGILDGISFDRPARDVMNPEPTVSQSSEGREQLIQRMRQKQISQIPVLDHYGRVIGLEILEGLLQPSWRDNQVVLMAGGLGTRLRPLTDDSPKPLLKVGGKAILETILENFREHGFRSFYISVNYHAEKIEEHFGDGSFWGVEIRYLREKQRMGTAGALSLLPEFPLQPSIVMNGDLLTKVDFGNLLDFHREHRAVATMCVREYDFQIPYGVVRVDGHRLIAIDEKPVQRFFVNAGIYVLEPEAMELIPVGSPFDMPALFEKLLELRKETVVFPIREYWLDIGKMSDFERANVEFVEVFG